jgi:HAE1 family hydrophobic/amphiphilic exporter-1
VNSPITIVVSIFASGLVSLTLTPLMCARLLKARGHGIKQNWIERVTGRIEKRVLGIYGASLWWFLRHRWISGADVGRLHGRYRSFSRPFPRPFCRSATAASSWGVMIGKEGSSPAQMRALQDKAAVAMRQDPSVGATVT